jgi:hypothetical protein
MSEFKDAYIIVKVLRMKSFLPPQHVFLIDSNNEVLEFDTEDEAKNIAELFEKNSENGWTYYVKKI